MVKVEVEVKAKVMVKVRDRGIIAEITFHLF